MAALRLTKPSYRCSSFSIIFLGHRLAFTFLRLRLSLLCSQSNFSRILWTCSYCSPFFAWDWDWCPTSLRPCWSTCGWRCFRVWKSSKRTQVSFLFCQAQIFACRPHLNRTSYAAINHYSSFCGSDASSFALWSDCWSKSTSDIPPARLS